MGDDTLLYTTLHRLVFRDGKPELVVVDAVYDPATRLFNYYSPLEGSCSLPMGDLGPPAPWSEDEEGAIQRMEVMLYEELHELGKRAEVVAREMRDLALWQARREEEKTGG